MTSNMNHLYPGETTIFSKPLEGSTSMEHRGSTSMRPPVAVGPESCCSVAPPRASAPAVDIFTSWRLGTNSWGRTRNTATPIKDVKMKPVLKASKIYHYPFSI